MNFLFSNFDLSSCLFAPMRQKFSPAFFKSLCLYTRKIVFRFSLTHEAQSVGGIYLLLNFTHVAASRNSYGIAFGQCKFSKRNAARLRARDRRFLKKAPQKLS